MNFIVIYWYVFTTVAIESIWISNYLLNKMEYPKCDNISKKFTTNGKIQYIVSREIFCMCRRTNAKEISNAEKTDNDSFFICILLSFWFWFNPNPPQ